ncbi:MAG: phosphatase PAP2 family protein [Blautia producta]
MAWEFVVLDWFQSIQNPVLTSILKFVTMLGEAGWFWILLGVLLLCSRKYRPCGVAVLLALLLDLVLANIILKPLVARPRPCWVRDTVEMLVRVPKDYSFPSGHTIFLLRRQKRMGMLGNGSGFLWGFRLYFYVLPTDVLAVFLGLLCLGRFYEKSRQYKIWKVI